MQQAVSVCDFPNCLSWNQEIIKVCIYPFIDHTFGSFNMGLNPLSMTVRRSLAVRQPTKASANIRRAAELMLSHCCNDVSRSSHAANPFSKPSLAPSFLCERDLRRICNARTGSPKMTAQLPENTADAVNAIFDETSSPHSFILSSILSRRQLTVF